MRLAQTPLADLLPRVRIDGGAPAPLLSTSSIFVPPQGARPPIADMILVTAIDLDEPRIVQSLGIVGTAETVYASTANLETCPPFWTSPATASCRSP